MMDNSEVAQLKKRVELLEEQIQGLVLYLGQQARANGWAEGDLEDGAGIKVARRGVPLKHQPSQVFGDQKLAGGAGMLLIAIRDTAKAT